MARRALAPWLPATTQLTFTSLVAISRRLMPPLARVSNRRAATPGRPMMPAPAMLILAMPPSAVSTAPAAPVAASHSRHTRWARSSSSSATVKAMSLLLPSWVACTIRSTFSPAAASPSNSCAATPGRSGTRLRASTACPSSSSAPSTGRPSSSPSLPIGRGVPLVRRVPGASLQLERTTKGTP